ncbi:hypothetical protein [Mycolicibacterium sp. P1-18]|nr:hypothetical protein [Mycolicibacterium sp. P1-18]
MSVVRVNCMPKFYFGDDAVLSTLDGGGVDEMRETSTSTPFTQGCSRVIL